MLNYKRPYLVSEEIRVEHYPLDEFIQYDTLKSKYIPHRLWLADSWLECPTLDCGEHIALLAGSRIRCGCGLYMERDGDKVAIWRE